MRREGSLAWCLLPLEIHVLNQMPNGILVLCVEVSEIATVVFYVSVLPILKN